MKLSMRQTKTRLIRVEMDRGKEESNRRRNQELKGETMAAKKERTERIALMRKRKSKVRGKYDELGKT